MITSQEEHEVASASIYISVAQHALAKAVDLANRGCSDRFQRGATQLAIKTASDAADDAQRAVNAELKGMRGLRAA